MTNPRSKRKEVKPNTKKDSPKDKYMNPTSYIDPFDYFDSSFDYPTDNGEELIELRPKLLRECTAKLEIKNELKAFATSNVATTNHNNTI